LYFALAIGVPDQPASTPYCWLRYYFGQIKTSNQAIMQQPPLSVILSWPKPNYIDPETRGYSNVVLNIILYTILLGFVGLRIWTRKCLKNAFGLDDTFILLALVCRGIASCRAKQLSHLWIVNEADR